MLTSFYWGLLGLPEYYRTFVLQYIKPTHLFCPQITEMAVPYNNMQAI